MKPEEVIKDLKYQEKMRSKGIDYRVNNIVINEAISALEKQIPKKPIHIHEEYEKHEWKKDKDGNVDEWAFDCDNCHGVRCIRCYENQCIHCNPNYDDDKCIVDKDLCPNCKTELSGYKKAKYCVECGQALDRSEEE